MPEESPLPDASARKALCDAAAALDGAERRARPFEMMQALTEVARCYLALGAVATAGTCLERALGWARALGGNDGIIEVLCELAHAEAGLANEHDARQRGRGHAARERARDHAFEASTLAGALADPGCEAQWLIRVSEVLERCGDRDDAIQVQTRALRILSDAPPHDITRLAGPRHLADG